MIELLAPAANLQSGIAAITAGADALYIGGPAFGAREKAGNSIEGITALANHAHLFGVKVYLTMNTIIYEHELSAAQKLVHQAWEAGVDAIIVQDMALTQMALPPIPLHASTQTFNLTVDRVKFLEDAGFDRVILERAITLDEIRKIRQATNVELEAFVHGAICVGYSGQCYLSESLCHRSGNRGACAQPCRSDWNLLQNSKLIAQNKPLLSVGDMNLSDHLRELVDAGVTSLKIEGRLKDVDYVVNNTAHYNGRLTELNVPRTSIGVCTPSFEPNPAKSFSRRLTTFMLNERRPSVSLLHNGEGGEYIGTVTKTDKDFFETDTEIKINNGDGISFAGGGTNINSAVGHRIFPNRMDGIRVGIKIFRNLDRDFRPTSERKIDAAIVFNSSVITVRDSDGVEAEIEYQSSEIAKNEQRMRENIINAFSKSGDTIFRVRDVDVRVTPFLPMSELNRLRRELLEQLTRKRLDSYQRPAKHCANQYPQLGVESLDYRANVANSLARQFYERCGVVDVEQAFELAAPVVDSVVLRSRHCVRREMGICLRDKGVDRGELYIENNGRRFRLEFDCAECEMLVIANV